MKKPKNTCPSCGSETYVWRNRKSQLWRVSCKKCGFMVVNKNLQAAIDNWDRRVGNEQSDSFGSTDEGPGH